ncbi:MAG: hypothetical protein IPI23_00685 [Bacteroidetes bacterium]|nr:hypothetical protein [Bacteroidota bacterium]
MVSIQKVNDNFVFELKGMHKLWALTSQLVIPASNISKAHNDFSNVGWWKGWRAPGTSIPFVLTAGTFHLDSDKIFWDVMNRDKSIIVELHDEEYKRLIIEVADPIVAMELLNAGK